MKITKLLKQPRVIILIVFLLISFFSINHQFSKEGVAITSIEFNSTSYEIGLRTPSPDLSPTAREKILEVNGQKINSVEEFYNAEKIIPINGTVKIATTKTTYDFLKQYDNLGITVVEAPASNLRKGLDLQGGTRVLLKPEGDVTDQDIKDVIDTMENRLNVYGLADVTLKSASDLGGNKFIVVEIAGSTKEEIKNLIANQGKFEAKIGNITVFQGGQKDITFVCRTDGTCSRIQTCQNSNEGYFCRFEFEISLSPEAAEKHADVTKNLAIMPSPSGQRALNETIDFYLDNQLVDQLQIDSSLKGQKATRVTISGSGNGATQKEALQDTINNRNKLQTILITGSLPTKLEFVKVDTISPSLGSAFVNNALLIGLIATIGVAVVIYIRYRSLKITIPTMITVLSEIFIILGFAALFKQNLDLVAIAAILAAVGTGVDDQIVIADEILFGGSGALKQQIKRAFFVILAAYAATVAAMLPLLRAGAGLLTGFAVVTIVGVTIGVFITRPAFGAIVRSLMEE
ncbi:hypothetical protein HYU23_01250 [Candidatus Woesearchaeota archaeon]|nr:hypothetical protein [Candidatus Woesearchaeota archaeon]